MVPLFVAISSNFFCVVALPATLRHGAEISGVFQYRPSSGDAVPLLRPCTK